MAFPTRRRQTALAAVSPPCVLRCENGHAPASVFSLPCVCNRRQCVSALRARHLIPVRPRRLIAAIDSVTGAASRCAAVPQSASRSHHEVPGRAHAGCTDKLPVVPRGRRHRAGRLRGSIFMCVLLSTASVWSCTIVLNHGCRHRAHCPGYPRVFCLRISPASTYAAVPCLRAHDSPPRPSQARWLALKRR
jgi:hypothetical protein